MINFHEVIIGTRLLSDQEQIGDAVTIKVSVNCSARQSNLSGLAGCEALMVIVRLQQEVVERLDDELMRMTSLESNLYVSVCEQDVRHEVPVEIGDEGLTFTHKLLVGQLLEAPCFFMNILDKLIRLDHTGTRSLTLEEYALLCGRYLGNVDAINDALCVIDLVQIREAVMFRIEEVS